MKSTPFGTAGHGRITGVWAMRNAMRDYFRKRRTRTEQQDVEKRSRNLRGNMQYGGGAK